MIVTVNPDLTSHIVNDDSTLECFLPNYNPETLVPFGSEDGVRAFAESITNPNYFVPYKSPEDREAERVAALVSQTAAKAKKLLLDTDWCENASVRNTDVTPHLTNGDAFDTYRLQLRSILVNNVADVETWPEQPTGVWST